MAVVQGFFMFVVMFMVTFVATGMLPIHFREMAFYTLVIAIFLGLIPANIAKSKGRSFYLWWLYGWLMFLIALIHVSVLDKNENNLISSGRVKKCPFCAEIIKKEAIVCRYCGRDLPEVENEGNLAGELDIERDGPKVNFVSSEPTSSQTKRLFCGIAIMIIVLSTFWLGPTGFMLSAAIMGVASIMVFNVVGN